MEECSGRTSLEIRCKHCKELPSGKGNPAVERTVAGYFDYIEDLIERENTFNMEQFASSINEFLTFRRYQILPDKGKISAAQAKKKAEDEYALFDPTQQIDSDFDKEVRKTLKDLA